MTRTVEGNHGWKATLIGRLFERPSGIHIPYHLLSDILTPLCDWWEETARDAVIDCPPPENVHYPHPGKDGRSRMIQTISEGYDRWDTLVFDNRDWGNLHLPMEFTFNGKAKVSDTIWPFAPPTLINLMTEAIKTALGTQEPTNQSLHRRPRPPWPANLIDGRKNWHTQRLYEDWTGRSPAERNVLAKQPKLLRPTGQWSTTISQHTRINICKGRPECQHSGDRIPPTTRHGVHSECDNRWHTYGKSLVDAFIKSNPEVQFGPTSKCLKQLTSSTHRCNSVTSEGCSPRARPLDHDRMCRFPDGERFIISHPYCGDDLCENCLDTVREWHTVDPEITWRTAGASRSWYFPNNSNLLIIGHQQTTDRLALDYPIPDTNQPTGCVQWRTKG